MKRPDIYKHQTRITVWILTISFILAGNFFILFHLSKEHYIYFWDISGYWISGIEFAKVLFSSPLEALGKLYHSILESDYNLLPAVLLSTVVKVVSASHRVYTLAVYNLYVVPFVCILLIFYRKILLDNHVYSAVKMLFGCIFLLLYTALLTPVLFGYLDAVGLGVIAAILILVYRSGFKTFKSSDALLITFLLVLLTLLRRWYLFWVVGFFVAVGVVYLIKMILEKDYAPGQILRKAFMFLSIGAGYLLILSVFFTRFLIRALKNNFQDAYKAYNGGDLVYNITHLFGFFSIIVMLFVLAGAIALLMRKKSRDFGIFLVVQAFVVFFLFTRVQSFGSQHVYLFVPSFAILAFCGICFTLDCIKRSLPRALGYVLAAALLFVNFYYVYIGDNKVTDALKPVLSQETLRPRVMNDIDEIRDMAGYLTSLTQDSGKTVYVLASSFVINDEILGNSKLPYERYAVIGLLATNHVDRRDGFPNHFLLADYIVVADPVQYHLKQSEQQVVGAIAQELVHNTPDNLTLLKTYALDKGVTAKVYQRTGPYALQFLDALSTIFYTSYPDYPSLNTISRFYGRLKDIRTTDAEGMVSYTGQSDIVMQVGKTGHTAFTLDNQKLFKRLKFKACTGTAAPYSAGVGLRIYDGDNLLCDDVILSEHDYDIDISDKDSLRFIIYGNDSGIAKIILKDIQME